MDISSSSAVNHYQLWFKPLSNTGTGLGFPCDGRGLVDLDSLRGCERLNYLYARALIGRDFGWPEIRRAMKECTVQ